VGPENELFAYTDDLTFLAGQIAATVKQFGARAVITHGSNGEYGHPAHKASYLAARLAVESFGDQAPLMYTVSASFPGHPKPHISNPDDPADLVLDIGPALELKTQAALCHRTQSALFVRRASQEAGRPLSVPEVIMRLESLHRASPAVTGAVSDEVEEVLRSFRVEVQPGD
jgi:LmbE family N-acetylglucosaminyl deacetylase